MNPDSPKQWDLPPHGAYIRFGQAIPVPNPSSVPHGEYAPPADREEPRAKFDHLELKSESQHNRGPQQSVSGSGWLCDPFNPDLKTMDNQHQGVWGAHVNQTYPPPQPSFGVFSAPVMQQRVRWSSEPTMHHNPQ